MTEKDNVDEKEKTDALIRELIEKRKAYMVYSVLGEGVVSPEGKSSSEYRCRDVAPMANEEGKYYQQFFHFTNQVNIEHNLPLFLLSANFADAILPPRVTHGDVGRIKAAEYQMLCSYCPSDEEGYSELIISGLSGSFDTRT